MVTFFAMMIFVGSNKRISHFIRFHCCQVMVIDIITGIFFADPSLGRTNWIYFLPRELRYGLLRESVEAFFLHRIFLYSDVLLLLDSSWSLCQYTLHIRHSISLCQR